MYCLRQKVNICGYCSLNSNRVLPKRVKKKKKTTNAKRKRGRKTRIQTYAKIKRVAKKNQIVVAILVGEPLCCKLDSTESFKSFTYWSCEKPQQTTSL